MPGTARTILIVEDEPLIAMMLEDFLESLGHEVIATCDSVAAALGHVEPPPAAHAGAPILAKPYTIDAIEPALDRACGG